MARSRGTILSVLKPRLPESGLVLEIAAGAGEHAVYNAAALPYLKWLPTDPAPEALASIAAWRDDADLPNLQPPMRLDAAAPDTWPVQRADAIININMIHITPWLATEGLLAGAGRLLLAPGGLILYGPYIERNVETASSNLEFDQSLRARNPACGICHLDEVRAVATQHGLEFAEWIAMPANNFVLVFRRMSN
jgi:hypothetical protein